jgi:putative ABC transport system substrate-binding protein
MEVRNPDDLDKAFQAATRADADGLITTPGAVRGSRKRIFDLAAKSRLPAIYSSASWAERGGLMGYGASLSDLYRRAATYVDKILKGAKPADLPVEQPMKFRLFVNLKTAKQLGLTIPPSILYRADKVIK